jgi:hypothetical protein
MMYQGGGAHGLVRMVLGRFLGGVRRYDFFFDREALGLRKCGFHQNSTPASAILTRDRVGLGGVAFHESRSCPPEPFAH